MSQPWTHTAGATAYARVDEHYVEPHWVSERLFQEEKFTGGIYDPACGFGRIVESAIDAGHIAHGADLVDRRGRGNVQDFLLDHTSAPTTSSAIRRSISSRRSPSTRWNGPATRWR